MPVQLTGGALGQVLLGARNVVALGQVLDDLFADPAAIEDARLRVGEAPLQIRYEPAVGRLTSEVVGVRLVHLDIGAAWSC